MSYLPNLLTVSRLFLTILFIIFLQRDGLGASLLAAGAFTAASLTDYFDGYLARKHQLITSFGKIMDPIADKFLMLAAFYIFADIGAIKAWMFWVIFAREILVTLSRFWAMKRGAVIAAEKAGKYKTVIQIVAVSVLLLLRLITQTSLSEVLIEPYFEWWVVGIDVLMYLTVAVTVYSGISYFWNNRRVLYA